MTTPAHPYPITETRFDDGRIGIRPYELTDVSLLYEAARESIPEMFPWMPFCHPNYSRDEAVIFVHSRAPEWNKDSHYSFVIYDLATGRFLGGVGINFLNRIHQFANLGYWVRTTATGQGAATAAARLAAHFGFTQLNLNRLEIIAAADNRASQRVAEKVGAHLEGKLRRRLLLHGQAHEALIYSLVAEDLGTDCHS